MRTAFLLLATLCLLGTSSLPPVQAAAAPSCNLTAVDDPILSCTVCVLDCQTIPIAPKPAYCTSENGGTCYAGCTAPGQCAQQVAAPDIPALQAFANSLVQQATNAVRCTPNADLSVTCNFLCQSGDPDSCGFTDTTPPPCTQVTPGQDPEGWTVVQASRDPPSDLCFSVGVAPPACQPQGGWYGCGVRYCYGQGAPDAADPCYNKWGTGVGTPDCHVTADGGCSVRTCNLDRYGNCAAWQEMGVAMPDCPNGPGLDCGVTYCLGGPCVTERPSDEPRPVRFVLVGYAHDNPHPDTVNVYTESCVLDDGHLSCDWSQRTWWIALPDRGLPFRDCYVEWETPHCY
jgi:hypothetical protein